ncbi:MAG: N-formylglutamate amidohydrolase [Luteibaculum sp.]
MKLVLSCEHFSNALPEKFKYLFEGNLQVLESHRGYDLGSQQVFEALAPLADFHLHYPYSRLLIEPNRSLHHPRLFSEFSNNLDDQQKQELVKHYYLPYRERVEKEIREIINAGQACLHLSVHSFTPVLDGQVRNADLGLLYDPKRVLEKDFSRDFKKRLLEQDAQLKIRFNYPYLGTADGFTTHLRKVFPPHYAGIELEIKNSIIHPELIGKIKSAMEAMPEISH